MLHCMMIHGGRKADKAKSAAVHLFYFFEARVFFFSENEGKSRLKSGAVHEPNWLVWAVVGHSNHSWAQAVFSPCRDGPGKNKRSGMMTEKGRAASYSAVGTRRSPSSTPPAFSLRLVHRHGARMPHAVICWWQNRSWTCKELLTAAFVPGRTCCFHVMQRAGRQP
jgi:hypothetical protein